MQTRVVNHISLDGVLQSPGRPDEDTRGGFRHGGWTQQANDPAMGPVSGERMGSGFCWLFGRRSYEDMLAHWNHGGGTFKDGLNNARKYVASSTPIRSCRGPTPPCLSVTLSPRSPAPREVPAAHS